MILSKRTSAWILDMTFAFSFPYDKLVRMSMFKVIVNLNTKTEVVSDVDVKDGVSVVVVVLQGFS